MTTVLLDTNIISFLLKGDTRAQGYLPLLRGHRLAISFMTVAELFEWATSRHWGTARVAHLEQALTTYLVVPTNIDLCRQWGILRAHQQAAGFTIAAQDAWIAATALRHQLPLITHNPSDFQYIPHLEVWSILP